MRMRYERVICALALLVLSILIQGCVEKFEYAAETFEDAIVVEATITDQVTTQELKISRTYAEVGDGPFPETSANVTVMGDDGSSYAFAESQSGEYISEQQFGAKPNVKYTLNIQTANGREYRSDAVAVTPEAQIDEVYAERKVDENGVAGVAIKVNGSGVNNDATYYQYRFEEAYKILSRENPIQDLIVISAVEPYEVDRVFKEREEYVCYNFDVSRDIIIESTSKFQQDVVQDFQVNFVPQTDPKVAQRYSILVKQFVLNRAGYEFYNTLKDISETESIFVQNQPGFLAGNIVSQTNPDEKVIGFFSVSSVSEKRIFFNFEDIFSLNDERGYFNSICDVTRPGLEELVRLLLDNRVKFLAEAPPEAHPIEGGGPYRVMPSGCIDCTLHGTNVKPDFWEE